LSTPFVFAAKRGHAECARYLLSNGASVNDRLDGGGGECFAEYSMWRSSLADVMLMALQAHPEMLQRVDINYLAKGMISSTLPEAAEVMRILFRAGLRPAVFFVENAVASHPSVIDVLLHNHCALENAFMCAVRGGTVENARRLLSNSADPTVRDTYGNVFHYAQWSKTPVEMIDFLVSLEPKLDVNATGVSGRTALLSFARKKAAVSVPVCERLLAAGALLTIESDSLSSAMHIAAAHRNAGLLELFAKHGADLNALDKRGNTPWMRFSSPEGGSDEDGVAALEWFLRRMPDEVTRTVQTNVELLSRACARGDVGLMRRLVRLGAPVAAHADELISRAVSSDQVDAVRLLHVLGARVPLFQGSLFASSYRQPSVDALVALVACGLSIRADDARNCVDESCFLLLLMLDAIPRAVAFSSKFLFVAACWWGLPVDDLLLPVTMTRTFDLERRRVVKAHRKLLRSMSEQKLKLINWRATDICIALADLELPALMSLLIVDEVCPLAPYVAIHLKYRLVTTVKHFRRVKQC
jgi:ankyrin repeat protein